MSAFRVKSERIEMPVHSHKLDYSDSDQQNSSEFPDMSVSNEEIVKTDDYDLDSGSLITRKPRGNLDKNAVNYLKNWLSLHRYNAYPSEDEKLILCRETGLTNLQICNWFINARRRILPDMLRKEGKDANRFKVSRRGKTLHSQEFDQIVTTKKRLPSSNEDPLVCLEEVVDMNEPDSEVVAVKEVPFSRATDNSVLKNEGYDDECNLIYSSLALLAKPKRKYSKRKKQVVSSNPNILKRKYVKKLDNSIQQPKQKIKKQQFQIKETSDDECGRGSEELLRSKHSRDHSSVVKTLRISNAASTSSESRRKSTPTRIAPVIAFKRQEPDSKNVCVKGVIRDPGNSSCLYLLVESSAL